MISLVVAMTENRVIGRDNDLPWRLPTDSKHFRELTTGRDVVMGRKTFESIMKSLGKPLPNRRNIVVTTNADYEAPEGVLVAHSLDDALAATESEEVCVIGGAQIYALALPLADRIFLTEIKTRLEGDAFFPEIGPEWRETVRESHKADDKNEYDFDFVTLERARA